MIRYVEQSDLFESDADALVNPVNSQGFMGKGVAAEFKKRFPEIMRPYRQACISGSLIPGKIMLCQLIAELDWFEWKAPKILLFPTKDHWRSKSKLEWIDKGLSYIGNHYQQWGIRSVATPQLGCGLGGLRWEDVQPLIEKHFEHDPLDVQVYLSAVDRYGERIRKSEGYNKSRSA